MNTSLKIGIISGLIAGIIFALVNIFIHAPLSFKLGIVYWWIPPPPETSMMHITIVELTINTIWGIVFGIFYSMFYDRIPGKRIFKSLVYGIILVLFWNIRWLTFHIAYFDYAEAISQIFEIYTWIVFALTLGIFYESLQRKYQFNQKKLKTSKSDIAMGIQAGGIGGLLGGIAISFPHELFWNPIDYPEFLTDIGFLIGQLGTHALINMIWGMVFGIFYARFYDRIPGKKVLKGITFGMMLYFIISFRASIFCLLYGALGCFISCANAIVLFLVFGIVLGYLYKPKK